MARVGTAARTVLKVLAASGALVLAVCAPPARAEVSDITLLGDQASLMAGAVTASTQAGSSMWYNPARLTFAGDQTFVLAVSGAGIAMRRYKVPTLIQAVDAKLDATTTEVLALPRATTLVARVNQRWHWGVGLFIPSRQDIGLQAGSNEASARAGFNAYAMRVRRSSYHLTGSVSYTLNERIQFGASLGVVTYSYFNMAQVSTAAYDSETGMAYAVLTTSGQQDNVGYGFRPILGVSIKLWKGLNLGISGAPPTMLFFTHLREVSSVVSADGGEIGIEPTNRDERGGAWDAVEAAVGRLGLSYTTERMLWEIDGELIGGAHSTDFNVNERVSGNLRAGGLIGLRRHVRLGFGFFTDIDHKRGALKKFGDTRTRGLGGTLGLNFVSSLPGQAQKGDRKGTYSITVAARYALYRGQVLGLSIGESGQADSIETVATDGTIHEAALQLGVNGAW